MLGEFIMHVILIFIDGIGLGEYNRGTNPLVAYPMAFFQKLLGSPLTKEIGKVFTDRICVVPTDAVLGIEGLPQSATGQTSIFTGLNAPALMGGHVHAFPGPRLAKLIREYGIIKKLVSKGFTATSANAYTPDYMELVERRRRRHSATTLAMLFAGQALRNLNDVDKGLAIYQDITNELLGEQGYLTTKITPAEAGKRLVHISKNYHFTMFEYFQTDVCGHKRNWEKAEQIVRHLDEFICSVFKNISKDTTVIITSDHGNFEDFSIKTHTQNNVPTIILGYRCQEIASKIQSITDITPTIIELIERDEIDD